MSKRKGGRPKTGAMPETPIQTQLSADTRAALLHEASRRGLSTSAIVRAIITKFLNGTREL